MRILILTVFMWNLDDNGRALTGVFVGKEQSICGGQRTARISDGSVDKPVHNLINVVILNMQCSVLSNKWLSD